MKKLFKFILLILFLCLPSLGWAATYYVDSAVTDTYVASATPDFTTYNPTTFATDTGSDSVYKTIADVNLKAFAAGDFVYFRKGQTWREQLTVPSSGSSGNPITFGAYGSGAAPKILGSEQLTTWVAQTVLPYTTNLQVWLDGQLSSITQSGGLVSQWNDISGNNNHAVQSTDSKKPTLTTDGAFNVLSFDGSTDVMGLTSNLTLPAFSFFAVVKVVDTATEKSIVSGENASPQWESTTNEKQRLLKMNTSVVGASTTAVGTATLEVYGITFDGTNYKFFKDVVTDGSGANATTFTATLDGIGAGRPKGTPVSFFNGNMAVVIIYSEALSETNALKVCKYLYDRYTNGVPTTNIWRTESSTTDPGIIIFDDGYGTEVTAANLDTSLEWLRSADSTWIYTYSTTDPDAAFTAIEASVRNRAILDDYNSRSYITIDGLEVGYTTQQAINFYGGNHITIINSSIHHAGPIDNAYADGIIFEGVSLSTISYNEIWLNGTHGIFLLDSDTTTVEHNTVHDNYHSDLDIQQQSAGASDAHIARYNYFYRSATSIDGHSMIHAEGAAGTGITNLEVYYNILVDLSSSTENVQGVQLETTVTPATIYNNVFYNIETYCLYLNNGTGTVSVKNNIGQVAANRQILYVGNATNKTVDYNDWNWASGNFASVGGTGYSVWATYKSGTGFDANSINSDPLFVSASDFHLQSSSPAINAGVNVGLTVDYSGNPIGTYPDIGAYEFQKNFTRGNYATLPLTDAQLSTEYSASEVTNASTSDTIRVGQSGGATQYIIHQLKNYASDHNSATVTWVGQSTLAPTSSTVYLQIYNQSSTTWETIDSDSVANANADFTLTTTVTPLTNYKDSDNYISCRVYQLFP